MSRRILDTKPRRDTSRLASRGCQEVASTCSNERRSALGKVNFSTHTQSGWGSWELVLGHTIIKGFRDGCEVKVKGCERESKVWAGADCFGVLVRAQKVQV